MDIWVIEDDAHLRDTLVELLGNAPDMICTLEADRCEKALPALENGDVPDVVLMDLGLPGMPGQDGIRRLSEAAPDAQVVVLTVHDDEERVFEALCAGAVGYLLKPATSEEVLAAVRAAAGGGSPMTPAIARKVLALFRQASGPTAEYGLTHREREILQLLVEERTQREIAKTLFLSPHTIDTHLRNIYRKLHVHSRTGAVAKALRDRLV